MSEVKRWDFDYVCWESKNGPFVHVNDYEAICCQLEKVQEQNRQFEEQIKSLNKLGKEFCVKCLYGGCTSCEVLPFIKYLKEKLGEGKNEEKEGSLS